MSALPPPVSRDLRLHHNQIFLWGTLIREGRVEPRHARLLRGSALEGLRICQGLLSTAGILPQQDRRRSEAFQDAERALVGFFDWAGRSQLPEQWEPLQTELYGNERLGELVLAQMEALDNNPLAVDYPIEALEVQARCLELGYHGHAANRRLDSNQLDRLKGKLAAALRRPLPVLSPPLPVLQNSASWRLRVSPLSILGMALLMLALLGGGVRFALFLRTDKVATKIQGTLSANGCP